MRDVADVVERLASSEATPKSQPDEQVGSPKWVRERLRALPPHDVWDRVGACHDLVTWLYAVVHHRAAAFSHTGDERADIAQDAMTAVFRALRKAHTEIASRDNPAAVLERIAEHAVAHAGHTNRMAGYSGVAPNGRNWYKRSPRRIADPDDLDLLVTVHESSSRDAVRGADIAAQQIARWTADRLGLSLTPTMLDATRYVLDRMLGGLSRSSLLRGRNGLARDPAMRFLGVEPAAARALAYWLLGQNDAKRIEPGVLDVALLGLQLDDRRRSRWQHIALQFGLADEASQRQQSSALPRGGYSQNDDRVIRPCTGLSHGAVRPSPM